MRYAQGIITKTDLTETYASGTAGVVEAQVVSAGENQTHEA